MWCRSHRVSLNPSMQRSKALTAACSHSRYCRVLVKWGGSNAMDATSRRGASSLWKPISTLPRMTCSRLLSVSSGGRQDFHAACHCMDPLPSRQLWQSTSFAYCVVASRVDRLWPRYGRALCMSCCHAFQGLDMRRLIPASCHGWSCGRCPPCQARMRLLCCTQGSSETSGPRSLQMVRLEDCVLRGMASVLGQQCLGIKQFLCHRHLLPCQGLRGRWHTPARRQPAQPRTKSARPRSHCSCHPRPCRRHRHRRPVAGSRT